MNDPVDRQKKYYESNAFTYEEAHESGVSEHDYALDWLSSVITRSNCSSLLDIGSGTGRALRRIKADGHQIKLVGIEPVKALREVGFTRGLTENELIEGDALNLSFETNSFDIVCCFGVLHHIRDHRKVVSEMCRVARHAVFISDSNNFGQGQFSVRFLKQFIRLIGLWSTFEYIRTGGIMYHYSDGDGVFYSYTIFDDINILRKSFTSLRFLGTKSSGPNLYRSAGHLAVLAEKKSLDNFYCTYRLLVEY